MKYYGFTEEQYRDIVTILNRLPVSGMDAVATFAEATAIIRQPVMINVDEEVQSDGKEIHKA